MKRKLITVAWVLILLAGLSVMLYPTVSDWWNSRTQSRAMADYDAALAALTKSDTEAMLAAAEDYNRRLSEMSEPLVEADRVAGYEDCLDVNGSGILGTITIEKIGAKMPIYHGTSGDVLNVAAGHLEGSSLPIGGLGTHAVISAHRGLPSARLFTDLNRLAEGDTFTITVLDRVMTYRVTQIRVVKPDQIRELRIDPDADLCTLMTCTPYGINTHRLLVQGTRVETPGKATAPYVPGDAYRVDPRTVMPAVIVVLLLLSGLGWWIAHQRNRKGGLAV